MSLFNTQPLSDETVSLLNSCFGIELLVLLVLLVLPVLVLLVLLVYLTSVMSSEEFVFAKKTWALGASVVLWQNWQNCQHGRQNLFMFKIQKL